MRVSTFDDLWREILQASGDVVTHLTDPVKLRLLRALLDAAPLTHYAAVRAAPGFVQVLRDLIAELKAGGVFSEDLTTAVVAMGGEPRLTELVSLYTACQQRLQAEGWADYAGIGWLAEEALKSDPHLASDWDALLVDGFDNLTTVQIKVLQRLAARVKTVTLTLTGTDDGSERDLVHQRFNRTRRRLEAALGVDARPLPAVDGITPPAEPLFYLELAPFAGDHACQSADGAVTLIGSLNALLRPVLGEEDPEHPYVEPFPALQHHRERPAAGLTPPSVELHLAVGSKNDGALARAAQALAARLAGLVERKAIMLKRDDSRDGEADNRPLDYGDVAILCRASASFAAYENALEAAGIPFLTVAGRGFYDRPEVRDLLNALQALADPTDDLALTGLLRSPAMGLSDMALYRLRKAQSAEEASSLWALLVEDDLACLDNEREQGLQARALIARLHAQVGRTPVAQVLKAFLDETVYRAALLRAGQTRAANNVAKLLADAHASDTVGVGAFVAYVAELRDVATREGEARAIAAGAVQIMTIHQAKGLEFPVIVIGDVARSTPSTRGVLIDAELGIVPPMKTKRLVTAADGSPEVAEVKSVAYRLAQVRDQEREESESDRLLYVAATRARELLLLNGTVRVYKGGGIGTYGWLDRLDEVLHLSEHVPACDGAGAEVHAFTLEVADHPVTCAIYEPEAAVPTAKVAGQQPSEVEGPDDLSLLAPVGADPRRVDEAVEEAERDPPRRVWRVVPEAAHGWAPAWVVGSLVHEALAAWRFPADADTDFAAWARAQARTYGLTDARQLDSAVQRSRRLLDRFARHPLCEEIHAATRRLHEVSYSVERAGQDESGVIDMLYRHEDRWTLVEFKTDRIRDEARFKALLTETDYVAQVQRYAEAVAGFLGERPVCYLCFLNDRDGVRLHPVP